MLMALAVLALVDPGGEPPSVDDGAAPPVDLRSPTVLVAGCRHRPTEDRCHLLAGKRARLRLWVDVDAQASVEVRFDEQGPAKIERVVVEGGQRLKLFVPAAAARVQVRGIEPQWRDPFTLEIVREHEPEVIAEARKRAAQGPQGTRAAIKRLDSALAHLEGLERLAALKLRYKLESPTNLYYAQQAAQLAAQLGRNRDFVESAGAALYGSLIDKGDLVASRRWVQRLDDATQGADPELRVPSQYYRALLDGRTGDLGTAVQAMAAVRRDAARLGMMDYWVSAAQVHASLLAEIGRGRQSLRSARDTLRLARRLKMPCVRWQQTLGNVGWIHLLLAQAGLDHDPPRALLREQLALVEPDGRCPDPQARTWSRIQLALVALADTEPEEAWAWLEHGQLSPLPGWLEPWFDEIRARVGLETGRFALLPAVMQSEPPPLEAALRWNRLVRQAQTLARLGLGEPALDTYLAAEQELDASSASLSVHSGVDLFLGGRQASARGLVDLLIRLGRPAEALCRARLAYGRELRQVDQPARIAGLSPAQRRRRQALLDEFFTLRAQLEQERRADWEFALPERRHRQQQRRERERQADEHLAAAMRICDDPTVDSCAELVAPGPGELLLLPFEDRAGTWLLMADDEATTAERTPRGALGAGLSRQAAKIERARRLHVLPSPGASLHDVPFGDGLLLDALPVAYSLDLPARPAASAAPAVAVVTADPSEDLPQARDEARAVARALTARGWSVEHHQKGAVDRQAMLEALGTASLFHYAGHGVHRGESGWESALLLGDGQTLGVSDILVLPRVPPQIILSGCETASVITQTRAGGMNLGRAFVLAGAQWVIATDGEVDDATAREVGQALYDALAPEQVVFDGAAALRRVLLRVRERDPDGDWARFRAVVP